MWLCITKERKPWTLRGRLQRTGYRLSAIGYRLSAIGYRLSAIGYRLSAIGYRLSAGIFLCVVFTSVHAVENWRIGNCQIIKDVPRKSGNTTSGYCGTNDSLEYHENLTVSIADLELSKGMTCKNQEKCISIKTTLYRSGEREVFTSCTNQTPSVTINGSSEGVMPKQIHSKAKSIEKSCLNLARDIQNRATTGQATNACNAYYPGKSIGFKPAGFIYLGNTLDAVVLGKGNGNVSIKIVDRHFIDLYGKTLEMSCTSDQLQ